MKTKLERYIKVRDFVIESCIEKRQQRQDMELSWSHQRPQVSSLGFKATDKVADKQGASAAVGQVAFGGIYNQSSFETNHICSDSF